jgi:hypothetical protein
MRFQLANVRVTSFLKTVGNFAPLDSSRSGCAAWTVLTDPVLSLLRLCCDFAPVIPINQHTWRLLGTYPAPRLGSTGSGAVRRSNVAESDGRQSGFCCTCLPGWSGGGALSQSG